MTSFLDRLDALAAKATPGPYRWGWRNDPITPGSIYVDDPNGPAVAMCPRYGKKSFVHDAEYIVALLNAAPALTRALRAAKEYRWCPGPKSCADLDAAMADLEKLK